MKRCFDIVFSLAGLVLVAPLLAAVALAIKLTIRGSVLLRQERVGKGFRPFLMYKFRTDARGLDFDVTVGEAPGITRLGRTLRRTKLDELPQLLNVLRGDMSLVGPRPAIRKYVRQFAEDYAVILKVRPGITDMASIAYRDEATLLGQAENPEQQYLHVILPDKLRLARHYVREASVGMDLWLIVSTVACLIYPEAMLRRLFDLLGRAHRLLAVAVQALLVAAAFFGAVYLRFDGAPPPEIRALALRVVPVVLAIRMVLFSLFGLHRGLWRYAGLGFLKNLTLSVALGSAAVWLLAGRLSQGRLLPVSVWVLEGIFCLALLGGTRFARRIQHGLTRVRRLTRRIIVIGSGDSTELLLNQLTTNRLPGYKVMGVLDRDPAARGLRIHNVPILGSCEELNAVIKRLEPDEVWMLGNGMPAAESRGIIRSCIESQTPLKAVPDLGELLGSNHPAESVTKISADHLLFREPIVTDSAQLRAHFQGRRVMITGAGGSIGSELCRQLAACGPSKLVLFEKHEASVYNIDRELRGEYPELGIVPVVGDILDTRRVDEVIGLHAPHVVLHAAAYKHVPMMELNPGEAFRTNVLGTKIVATTARRHGVDTFVMISTDKAVEPLSVMGLSKRMAELTLQRIPKADPTRLVTVRFGNVLESSGSVIPLFKEQIEKGGPVTVTHPEVTRLFMTVQEAVHLVLHAATMGRGGEVFVLDMGRPIRIVDMARTLIRLYGYIPGRDIRIVFTGLRPGERLFEKLVNDHERVCKTSHPKIMIAVSHHVDGNGGDELERLTRSVGERLPSASISALREAALEVLV